MILVAGTKRSGTSMWMQILQAAGFKMIGDAFPRDWGGRLREANPQGFWESSLREGIYYRSNPNPETGHFIRPEVVRGYAVKVFPFGVVRTDLAYIEAIVGTMRDWRSYARSLQALRELEGSQRVRPIPAWAEWWIENYELVRDLVVRGHSVVLQTYDRVLREPEESIRRVLNMLGEGDLQAAIGAVVQPGDSPRPAGGGEEHPPEEFIAVFDELFDLVDRREPLVASFIERMNTTHIGVVESLGVKVSPPRP